MPTMYGNIPEQAIAQVEQSGHEIVINRVSNGFVVRVGCKTLVFKTLDELIDAMRLYYKDQNAARMKYCLDELQHIPKGVLKRDLHRNRPRKARRSRKSRK